MSELIWDTTGTSEIKTLQPKAGFRENGVLKPGITGLNITKIGIEEDKFNKKYLKVVFKHKESGATYVENFFAPDPTKDSAAAVQKIILAKTTHIFGMLSNLNYSLPENRMHVTGFTNYLEQMLATVPENYAEIEIKWLKLTYGKDKEGNYTNITTPGYPPFLSTEANPRDYIENLKGEYKDRFVPEIINARQEGPNTPDAESGPVIPETGDDDVV